MNNVNLIGRIVNDLEVRNVGQDLTILSFAVAVNERRGQNDETSFFDITAWGKQAETIAQYFKKGQRIGIVGKLRQERWQDKEGGNRSRIVIVLREFSFIEPKDNNSGNMGGNSGYPSPEQNSPQPNQSNPKNSMEFDDFPSDDIPLDDEVPF